MLILLLLALLLPHETSAALVAHYEFSDDFTDSVGANDGTPFGGVTFTNGIYLAPPRAGYFPTTNGNQYMDIPRVIENSFSVSFWMKTTKSGQPGIGMDRGSGLVNGEVTGARDDDWGICLAGDYVYYGVGNTPDVNMLSKTAVVDGQWHRGDRTLY